MFVYNYYKKTDHAVIVKTGVPYERDNCSL